MEVGREADKGMPRARYCMCAFQFDLTPLISLLGRRSTAQGNGRGYYIAAAAGITAPGCGHYGPGMRTRGGTRCVFTLAHTFLNLI